MDDRFPAYLRWLVRKLDFIALPNLGMLICGLAVLGFIGTNMLGAPMERFLFDPIMVQQGEYWRLFAFPFFTNPIWLLFFVMYTFFVMNSLESAWGTAPLTHFTLLSYVCAIGGAFLLGRPVPIWIHVMENISLAFGTLFPNVEFYLFFVIPVRAKWLAMFAGALLFLQFLTGPVPMKLFLALTLAPYLIFFGPMLYRAAKMKYQISKNRNRWGD